MVQVESFLFNASKKDLIFVLIELLIDINFCLPQSRSQILTANNVNVEVRYRLPAILATVVN